MKLAKRAISMLMVLAIVMSFGAVSAFALAPTTVTISGSDISFTQNDAASTANITLTADDDTWATTLTANTVVTTWFTGLPAGLKAEVVSGAGTTALVVKISGTPSALTQATAIAASVPTTAFTTAPGDALSLTGTVTLAVVAPAPAIDVSTGGDGKSGGSITGESGLEEITYKVTVPSNINFVLNPLDIGDKGQIYGSNYVFSNQTKDVNVHVNLAFSFAAGTDGKSGAVLVDSADDLSDDIRNVDKQVYMSAVGAGTGTRQANTFSDLKYTGTDAASRTAAFDSSTGKALLSFLLKASANGTDAAATGGATAFTFQGGLNAGAPWAAKDVIVTAAYSFVGVADDYYTAKSADLVGLNFYETVPAATYGYAKGTNISNIDNTVHADPLADGANVAAEATITLSEITASAAIPLMLEGDTISKVWYGGEGITWSDITSTMTIGKASSETPSITEVKFARSWDSLGEGTYYLYFALKGGDIFKLELVITG